MEFCKSEKSSRINSFTGCEKCCPISHLGALTDIRIATARKNIDTLLAILVDLEVKFRKSEKVPESQDHQDSGTFSDLRNSTFKYRYRPCEVPQFFSIQV